MITFDNVLDVAVDQVCAWDKKNLLSAVTVIRDVFGKLSFLMDETEVIDKAVRSEFEEKAARGLGLYFSERVYWKTSPGKQERAREEMLIHMIEEERQEWREKEGILFYLSERAIAKKAWVYQQEGQESVWPYEEAVVEGGSKVVTFYSFKGGMGRTTTLAGVALSLVQQGKNVMMIDMDIEAPGLATLFFDDEMITKGVLDYLIGYEIDRGISIADYVLDVTDPALLDEGEGRLYLMPAGRVDENYLQKLARIDHQDNRAGHLQKSLMTMLKNVKERYQVDYILLDARAGFHDMGGVAVTQLPHGVVLFGNDNRQSWDGLAQVLRAIAKGHAEDFPVMLVGTMCPDQTDPGFIAAKERFIQRSYTMCIDNYYNMDSEIPGIGAEGETHFPESIPFTESLMQGVGLYSDGSQEKDQQVGAYKMVLTKGCYRKIADRMKGWFGDG